MELHGYLLLLIIVTNPQCVVSIMIIARGRNINRFYAFYRIVLVSMMTILCGLAAVEGRISEQNRAAPDPNLGLSVW